IREYRPKAVRGGWDRLRQHTLQGAGVIGLGEAGIDELLDLGDTGAGRGATAHQSSGQLIEIALHADADPFRGGGRNGRRSGLARRTRAWSTSCHQQNSQEREQNTRLRHVVTSDQRFRIRFAFPPRMRSFWSVVRSPRCWMVATVSGNSESKCGMSVAIMMCSGPSSSSETAKTV